MERPGATPTRGRITVFGWSGFIGRKVVAALEDAGHAAICVDRSALDGDLVDVIAGSQCVINLAAAGVVPKVARPEELRDINALLPRRIIEAMDEAGVAHAVMAGTASEYGRSADRYHRIPPDAPLEAMSDYARSKVDGFRAATDAVLGSRSSLDYLRVFNAFGEGQDVPALWPSLASAAMAGEDLALSSGTQVRDFIPVEDVATTFLRSVEEFLEGSNASPVPGTVHVRNVGTGTGRSVRAFATSLWEEWGAAGRLHFGALPDRDAETARVVADPDRVQVIAGSAPNG